MRHILQAGAAALAIMAAGCGAGEGDKATDNATAEAAPTASFCAFTAGDTRAWKASISAMPGPEGAKPPLVVTGQARVWGETEAPVLGEPDSAPPALRLRLTKAKAAGAPPQDGFWEVKFELPDPGAIETVVIRCADNSDIATIKVEHPS